MAGAPTGNQNARNAKIWQQAIKRALARRANSTVDDGLDELADKIVGAAMLGEQWAILEIGNRMDGKPAQTIGGDPDSPPLQIEQVRRVIVHANSGHTDSGGVSPAVEP